MNAKRQPRNPLSPLHWLLLVGVSVLVSIGSTVWTLNAVNHGTVTSAPTQTTAAVGGNTTHVDSHTMSDAVVQVVQERKDAVMAVVNYQTLQSGDLQAGSNDGYQAAGVGTSVLILKSNDRAFFVTNNHVVQQASRLEVVLPSGQHVVAQVIGTDPYTDLAVFGIPVSVVKDVQPVPLANSDNVRVGETVVAIGTPQGLDFQDSVTSGIISGKQRIIPVLDGSTHEVVNYQLAIQTDAAINPGNSGGPLLNLAGQIVGINSNKIVDSSVQGMGFAIPANQVKTVVDQLIKNKHVEHPTLGIEGYSLDTIPQEYWPSVPVSYGVYVYQVTSPDAKTAGLRTKDVIVALNGDTVTSVADLRAKLFQFSPNEHVKVTVYREHKKIVLDIKLGTEEKSL